MNTASVLCDHARPGQWPFRTELVLDEHPGITDVLARCRECGRAYLLELLDWRADLRALRVSTLEREHAERLIRDLTRGSCDVQRADAEVAHARSLAPFSRQLLLIDSAAPAIVAVITVPADVKIPGGSWREMPCDGQWIDYLRSKTEIVNE